MVAGGLSLGVSVPTLYQVVGTRPSLMTEKSTATGEFELMSSSYKKDVKR